MRIYCERGDFDLPGNFSLEILKYNPFVSDAGEQSFPITLKSTPNNKYLTNYSARLDKRTQPVKEMTVVIQDKTISRKANMVFHSHSNKEISATIYFAEGDFYSLIDGKNLIDDIVWPTETQVDAAAWYARCHRVYDGIENANWKLMETMLNKTIHLGLVSQDTLTVQKDLGEMPIVTNLRDYFLPVIYVGTDDSITLQDDTKEFLSEAGNSYVAYYYKEGENWCKFPALYLITPMLKTNWLLQYIFSYFGFEFTNPDHADLSEDVVSCSVIDALCRGVLYYKQLVPDKSISEFIKEFELAKCARFVFNGRYVTYEPFTASTSKPINRTIDTYRTTDEPTITVEEDSYDVTINVTAGEDYVLSESLIDGSIQGVSPESGGFTGESFPIHHYEDYETFKKWTQNNPIQAQTSSTTETINGAGTDLLIWAVKFVFYGINYQGKMLSQIAKIQEPVWLNTQVVDTTSGEQSITEADSRQSSTWCLLKSRPQMYHGFFLYEGLMGYEAKYLDVILANVAQSVFVNYNVTLQNPTYQYLHDVLYANFLAFRNKANVIVDTTCRIPYNEFAMLDITAPSMLENQPVMIESITYTIPLNNEDQTVRLRTLREQEPDTSIQ